MVALLLLLHHWSYPTSGTDFSAQLARATFAAEAPLTPVDFGWYSGFHPYGYSLLAPWLMATVGIAACGLLSAVGSAVLFARLTRHLDRPWLTALTGAVFWAANVASGRVTFALGACTALAALVLLRRPAWAASLAVLTGLLSPVAAAFLGFVAAIMVVRRMPGGWLLGLSTTVPVVALAAAFPGGGVQPLSPGAATPAILVGIALAAATTHPLVRTGAIAYAAAVTFFLVHDDPFGSNVLRLGLMVAVSLLLATTLNRTRGVVVVLALGFLTWQLEPAVTDLRSPSVVSFTALNQHLELVGSQRVEVLAGRDHREASEVIGTTALARGWARQIDVRDNPLFYRSTPLQPRELRDWLARHAVDRVAVPRRGALDAGSTATAELLQQPIAGLTEEWRDRDWVVYRVEDAEPVVSAPGQLLAYERTHLSVRAPGSASVAVNIRWSRWLSVSGPACLERAGDRVVLRFERAGVARLTSDVRPAGRC